MEKILSKNNNIRIGEMQYNNQGCLMKIIEYVNCHNIIIEFQDEYKAKVHSQYSHFVKGNVKNPYYPSVCGVGIIGSKYPTGSNWRDTKEYISWHGMLERCCDEKFKETNPAYQNVTCCKEWLLFENFYEWLHNQQNFDRWLNEEKWAIDKDILVKGNKIYSPDTCCLVPQNVNTLFVKNDVTRGDLPIGVSRHKNGFRAYCNNPFTHIQEKSMVYPIVEQAFFDYKNRKEFFIKQVAEIEYNKGNITKDCYEAMMNYEVEIDD